MLLKPGRYLLTKHAYINEACATRQNMLEACSPSVWDDNDTIPLGVVTVHVRAPSPSTVELDAPCTRWQYLDMDVLHQLEAHEQGAVMPVLRSLVEKRAAKVALEQDVLALWAAGMYQGSLHVHVLAVPENTRLPPPKKRHISEAAHEWLILLPKICTEAATWNAMSRDMDGDVRDKPFWREGAQYWALAEIYRQLPSPPTLLPCIHEESFLVPAGLRCALFAYQQSSLAKLLQRELWPETYSNPYFLSRESPCVLPHGDHMYAFDPECFKFYRWPDISLYPDVRGGILCDEMGAGKTLICLALILATLDQISRPEHESMTSCITSEMAMQFPDEKFQDKDPAAGLLGRIVTAPFGAPSPGERLGRRPITHIPKSKPETSHATHPITGSVSLAKIAAHRLRTTHACRPDLLDTLPSQVQAILGRESAPFILLWPPLPLRVSRVNHNRSPLRVYLTSATLVLVPPTLLMHWLDEMEKHCEPQTLRVLCITDIHTEIPAASQLSQDYDVVLMSHARFGKEAGDDQSMRPDLDMSPLMQVYWKRLIIDEGNMVAGDSLLVRLCAYLRVERRWVVTGTPTQALVGASALQVAGDESAVPTHTTNMNWTASERKNLDKLKYLLVRFLRIPPMCGAHASMPSATKASDLPPFKERDWNVLMGSGMNEMGEWPAKRRLYDILSRLMIRNRIEDVERDCPLPPLERRIVSLPMSSYERMTYNVLQSLIMLNAALSQEKDKDYFFHTSNKKVLASIMENLALACFHFAGQGFLQQAQQAHDHTRQLLDKPHGVAKQFKQRAIEALHQLSAALQDETWCERIQQGDVLYKAEHPEQRLLLAWSRRGTYWLTAEELLLLRDTYYKEAAHVPNADDLFEELLGRGVQYVHRKTGHTVSTISHRSPKTKNVLKRVEALLDERSVPLRTLPAAFQDVRVHASTSTKLNGMLQEILDAVPDEKVLVFSTLDHVLYELANALELCQVPFLFYVSGMSQHLRNTYVNTFMHKSQFRCLLMSAAVGGRGLDLHCASRIILAEPIWQWDLESQVVKRAWRMGQTRRVLVSTYVMQHTYEERLIERKKARFLKDNDAAEQLQTLTDDPGMRAFFAHPQLIQAPAKEQAIVWTRSLLGDPVMHPFMHASKRARYT